MTLGELKKLVMNIVGEDSASPTYWTDSNDSELRGYINDAVEEVCILTGQYVEDLNIPVFANRQHYILDFSKGSQLLWINHARIEPESWRLGQVDPEKLSREDYNWMTRTGTPINFCSIGLDTIRLIPFPTVDGKVIEMNVTAIPPTLTKNDNVFPQLISLIIFSILFFSYIAYVKKNYHKLLPKHSEEL